VEERKFHLHLVPIPPLSRNCEREDSVTYGHWETGKIDGKIALKPGNFGIR